MPQFLSFLALECPDKWSEYEGICYKVVDRLGYPRRFDHFMAPKLLNGQCYNNNLIIYELIVRSLT